ncbi:MAG: class IV lanthionine synthetase LanL, partial [Actinomycetota bacterium]
PNGNPVPDERLAWFSPPAWVTDPFAASESSSPQDDPRPPRRESPGGAVLLNGRYIVRQALKHANKGGVYLAEDRVTGTEVVLKEARAHVESQALTGYSVDSLRHEARLLDLVAHLGRTPRLLEVFEQQGHLFLVLEHFAGRVLREEVSFGFAETGREPSAEELVAMIRKLAETMEAMHGAGVLLHDFTPNNLMVLPGGELRLVDLELAHLLSDGPPPDWVAGTPAFISPDRVAGKPSGLPDDYFSLGATIGCVALGSAPNLAPDRGQVRPMSERLRDWVIRGEHYGRITTRVCDLVLGCMADDPRQRWGPRRVLEALGQPGRSRCAHELAPVPVAELSQALGDIGRWMARTINPGGQYLWPTNCAGLTMDSCDVQAGAGGTGLFLCQASRVSDDPALLELVTATAKWVSETIAAWPARPPGLYFGLSGAAWFLGEAAALLEDETLASRASEIALAVPVTSFNPDLTHGTAGIGLGQLHQWELSGEDRFLDRVEAAAADLARAARPGPAGPVWAVPEDATSTFAGLTMYGFAHGSSGIAYFLLCAAAALGEARYRELALEGVETLMRVARLEEHGATWVAGPGEAQIYAWPHWCHGASGVGTVLIRAYAVTGEQRYRRMAELAVGTVMKEQWRSSLVQCHGLAGNGEFLLDLHQLTGVARYRDLAIEIASSIYGRRTIHDGLVVFPDDTEFDVTASYNTGLAGIGSFLLRLLHGGPRPLMTDKLLEQGASAARA